MKPVSSTRVENQVTKISKKEAYLVADQWHGHSVGGLLTLWAHIQCSGQPHDHDPTR